MLQASTRGIIAAALAACSAAHAADWSDTSIGWRYGTRFGEPYIPVDIKKNIVINKGALAALSPEVRRGLQEAAQAFQARMLGDIPAREQADLKTLETKYKIKLQGATPADVAKMRKLMEPYWDEWAKAGGPKVVEALGQVRKAVGR